ncbi:MAG TPA: ABC transporter permease subunit [Methylococcaceae bacterium]|nr:ABC transporter permease subunit [Methylococcaceae bacterium]
MRSPKFWGLHADPPRGLRYFLAALPFILLILVYWAASDARHAANPDDKLLPGLGQMLEAIHQIAFTADKRTGQILFWHDTLASLSRLGAGVGLALICALLAGLNIGLFPGVRALLSGFLVVVSMIPPLAILPILFITLGVDEGAKIALIFIGTFPILTRDITHAVRDIPGEQIVKSLTLGASATMLAYRIVLPQILPRAIDSLRLVLGGAWLFLIAAEAIAATEGLGYRIFLVRRYLAMDVIIPYVAWITLLGFSFDFALRRLNGLLFPWYGEAAEEGR